MALVATCVIVVTSAVSASAVTFLLAEWLESGSGITATLLAETIGELAFTETLLGSNIDVLCSFSLDGFIGPDGAGEVTELLNLSGTGISLTGLAGTALECTNSGSCGEPLFWAIELPWLTLLVLMEDGTETFFADLLVSEKSGGKVGYEFECMSLGLADTCKLTETASLVENEASAPDSEFSEAFTLLIGLTNANCEIAGTESFRVAGLVNFKVSGTTLTASE